MKQIRNNTEIFLLGFLAAFVYLLSQENPGINSRLMEPVVYVFVLLSAAFLLRKFIEGWLINSDVFKKDDFLVEVLNPLLIPRIFIGSFSEILVRKINMKSALLVLLLQTLVTVVIVFFFNAANTSSGFVLLTFLYLSVMYFLFLGFKKNFRKFLPFIVLAGLAILIPALLIFGWVHLVNVALAFFCYWAFLFGLHSDRTYVYGLALIFIALLPFFIIVEQANPEIPQRSEFIAFSAYMLLVLGVLKDLFYDWVFEN